VTEADVENPRSSTVEVTVNVLDRNDNSPVFPAAAPTEYSVVIPEGDGRTRVVQVGLNDLLQNMHDYISSFCIKRCVGYDLE